MSEFWEKIIVMLGGAIMALIMKMWWGHDRRIGDLEQDVASSKASYEHLTKSIDDLTITVRENAKTQQDQNALLNKLIDKI